MSSYLANVPGALHVPEVDSECPYRRGENLNEIPNMGTRTDVLNAGFLKGRAQKVCCDPWSSRDFGIVMLEPMLGDC